MDRWQGSVGRSVGRSRGQNYGGADGLPAYNRQVCIGIIFILVNVQPGVLTLVELLPFQNVSVKAVISTFNTIKWY